MSIAEKRKKQAENEAEANRRLRRELRVLGRVQVDSELQVIVPF